MLIIPFSILHQQLHNSMGGEHVNMKLNRACSNVGASSSHYPLGLPVNLWMTIVAFQQCILLVHFTHVSSVLFFVSFWRRNVFLLRWLHINVSSWAVSCFPRDWKPSLCVAFRMMKMNCASSPALWSHELYFLDFLCSIIFCLVCKWKHAACYVEPHCIVLWRTFSRLRKN
jgi:hypothetical protein